MEKRNDLNTVSFLGFSPRKWACSEDDIKTVLREWPIIMENHKEVELRVFRKLFTEHPSYVKVFKSLPKDYDENFEGCEKFQNHAYAVLKGLDMMMSCLSGQYEHNGEMLAFIGRTHSDRKITKHMFTHLKEALVTICCEFLKTDKRKKASWQEVMNFIFENYLTQVYSKI